MSVQQRPKCERSDQLLSMGNWFAANTFPQLPRGGGGGSKSLETHLGWHVGLSVRALRDQTPTGGAGTFHHQWQKEGKGEHLKVWAVQGVA